VLVEQMSEVQVQLNSAGVEYLQTAQALHHWLNAARSPA
jgi:hypothetical protein